jgi:SAM-dependent methyltransferase
VARLHVVGTATGHFVDRAACPACQAGAGDTVYARPFVESPVRDYLLSFYSSRGGIDLSYLEGTDYILARCGECGLVYQKLVPDDDLMARIYDEWTDPAHVLHESDSIEYRLALVDEIVTMFGLFPRPPAALRFLDFGMGSGIWCRIASALGCRAYGSEISGERLTQATSSGIPVVSWSQIPGGGFDLINAEQVFEHVRDPLTTLRHLRTGLRPGGVIKISVPRGDDIMRRLRTMDWTAPKGSRDSLNAVSPLEHINCFGHRALARMGAMAGLELFQPRVRAQHAFLDWRFPKATVKSVLRPVYRRLRRRGTYVYLRETRTP